MPNGSGSKSIDDIMEQAKEYAERYEALDNEAAWFSIWTPGAF